MTRLMTMSSCLSPGSNLELRRWESALVFVFFCVCGQDVVCQRAAPWHHHYPTASRNASFCRPKIKETDAGATSRALPTGNRPPLKAWQGKKTKTKQQPKPLCGLFVNPHRERERVIPLSFFCLHSSFFHPSLSSGNNRKTNCTAILCFILTVFTVATTIFHTLKTYSKCIFFPISKKDSRSAQRYKKVRKKKGKKVVTKPAKKPTTTAPNLPTTHLFWKQI